VKLLTRVYSSKDTKKTSQRELHGKNKDVMNNISQRRYDGDNEDGDTSEPKDMNYMVKNIWRRMHEDMEKGETENRNVSGRYIAKNVLQRMREESEA
jgi:hypothetical protein